MSLTLLALLMLPFFIKMVVDPKHVARAIEEWGKSQFLQIAGSFASLFMGLFILLTNTYSLEFKWQSLICWIGVIAVLKGLLHLIPQVVQWNVRLLTEKRLPMIGFVGLLFSMAIVYIDVQILY